MVTAPIAVNSNGVPRPGRRGLRQSLGIALMTLALGVAAALIVGTLENQVLTSAYGLTGVTKVLPADLFAAPKAPNPRVVYQYRYVMIPLPAKHMPMASAQPSASMSPSPSASASPSATPTPSRSPRPTPSGSPPPDN